MSKRGLAIITVIGLLVFGCSSHKQEVQKEYTVLGNLEILPKISLLDFELKGDVKSISEYEYEAILKFGEYEKIEPCSSIIEHLFNAKGMIFETITYVSNYSSDHSMVLKKKSKYLYNINNLLEKIDVYGMSGELVEREVYLYDPNNKCIEKAQYNGDGSLIEQRLINYDKKGRIMTYERYYRGKLSYSTKYNYDKRGRLIESTSKDSHKSTSYKYDKLNNVMEEVEYNSKGWILYKTFYKYRGKEETEMIELDPIDLMITRTNYVKSGKVLTFFEKGDESVESRTYIYNNKHELIEDKYADGGSQIFRYDDKSNWNYNLLVTTKYNVAGEIVGTDAWIKVREINYWN